MSFDVYRGNPRDGHYFHQQNNDKRIKANEDQDLCFCGMVALKRVDLIGSTESRFQIFLNFSYEEELTVSFISF